MKFNFNLKNLFLNLLVLVAAFIIIFPIFWIILMSLKSSAQVMEWPPVFFFEPTLDNYNYDTLNSSDHIPNFLKR